MRKEYRFWITENIKGFRDRDAMITLWSNSDLNKVLDNFTDEDYETVSDKLTNAIEEFLLERRVPKSYAIRYSWKWSD